MTLKIAQILDLYGKSSGLAYFENIVDRGSAVIFDADCGLCLSYVRILSPKRNLDHRSFFRLSRYVNEFIQCISFIEISSFKLQCETVIAIVLCYSLIIWVKLTVAFTCTSLPLKLITSVFRMWLWFRIWTKILADRRIWRKTGTDRRICTPLFTPLFIESNVCGSFSRTSVYQDIESSQILSGSRSIFIRSII